MFKFICVICLFFASTAQATLYIYDASGLRHPLGSISEEPGWDYALVTYVNQEQRIWQLNDALIIINGSTWAYRIYNANGRFVVISEDQAWAIGALYGAVYLRVISNTGGSGGCAVPTDCFSEDYNDPLLIDLGQDEFHLGSRMVQFDFFSRGQPTLMQWVEPNGNDAFLFIDLNNNGVVDNGRELFGNSMYMIKTLQPARNGFEALAQYNTWSFGGNEDNMLNNEDLVWPRLQLWLDSDANGVSTEDEIMTLAEAGIVSLSLDVKLTGRQDSYGNLLPLWSWATNDNQTGNRKHKIMDVIFNTEVPAYMDRR